MVGARPAFAAPVLSTVTLSFADASGVVQEESEPLDYQALTDLGHDITGGYWQERYQGRPRDLVPNKDALSAAGLITTQGGVVSHVTSVVIAAPFQPTVTLHPELGDLTGAPFGNGLPPAFFVDANTGDIGFVIGYRAVPVGQAGVNDDGTALSVSNLNNMAVTINLDGTLLRPTVTGPTEVAATQTATFTASLPPDTTPPGAQWSWNFGDSPNPDPDQHGATATHAFSAEGGPYHVRATVTGSDGSSGLSPAVDVMVGKGPTNTTSPPPTTASPTDSNTPTLGNGAPTDPAGGPRDGDGPLAGGVPTDRGGTGAPGNSFDPRPSGVAATATAGDGAVLANGDVVGYVLSDPSRAAEIAQPGARKPRDDSAPAARTGTTAVRLSGWIVAAAVVVALLALGAGSERRRPTTTRARRKR